MNGWVKWHRKIIENEIWLYDWTAWHIFEYLWGVADYKTGTVKRAYSTMSEYLKIPKSTLSRAISRLEKAKMVNTSRNPNYTLYTICNWHKYQEDTQHFTQQARNLDATKAEHIQELRIKELRKESITPTKKELITDEEKSKLIELLVSKKMDREFATSEIEKFISYWTELNHSKTKQRWQMEKTFEVNKRLATWFNNIKKFNGGTNAKIVIG